MDDSDDELSRPMKRPREEAEEDDELNFLNRQRGTHTRQETNEEEEENETAKRQRFMRELILQEGDDDDDIDDGAFRPMDYNELVNQEYTQCYACDHINKGSLRDNDTFVDMMRMYTDNAASTFREASYRQIKEKFDEECREHTDYDWTLDQIREHFEKHTQYPTDEILFQIRVTKNLRNNFLKTVLSKRRTSEGREEIQAHSNNVKILLQLQKEIRELMLSIEHVSKMAGYDTTLNY